MTHRRYGTRSRRRWRLGVSALAAGLGVGGLAAIAAGATVESHPAAVESVGAIPPAHPATAQLVSPRPAPPPILAASPPVSLQLPTLGVETTITALGLNPDHSVQVPTDFDQAGWYRGGPSPGEQGPAAILGHVDSYRGPAVFYRLGSLHPGDPIVIRRADGGTATFHVDAIREYAKNAFPTEAVYGHTDYAALRLITCGGHFNRTLHSYDDNLVVYAHLSRPD